MEVLTRIVEQKAVPQKNPKLVSWDIERALDMQFPRFPFSMKFG